MKERLKDIVIFDLDGTLADVTHRRHFVEKPDKVDADWRAFYAACTEDDVNRPVAEAFDALRDCGHYEVWIVSGRSDEVREATEQWLFVNDLEPHKLLMRSARDHQPDTKLKKAWLDDGTIPKGRVLCVFDDRDSVVAMWRAEGLACFQVAPGDF